MSDSECVQSEGERPRDRSGASLHTDDRWIPPSLYGRVIADNEGWPWLYPEEWPSAVTRFLASRRQTFLSDVAREALGIAYRDMEPVDWRRLAGTMKSCGWAQCNGSAWMPV
jgi:hypothetical protein